MTERCQEARSDRRCDLIARHGGPHMWLNLRRPLVVAWGYVNDPDGDDPPSGTCTEPTEDM